MAKDYSVQGTTKLQREKYAEEALAISMLGARAPSDETMRLLREHIDGKCEISDVLNVIIKRYKTAW